MSHVQALLLDLEHRLLQSRWLRLFTNRAEWFIDVVINPASRALIKGMLEALNMTYLVAGLAVISH